MRVHDLDTGQLEAALREAGRALEGARHDISRDVVVALRAGTPARHRVRRRLVPIVVIGMLLTGAAIASTVVPGIGVRIGLPSLRGTQAPLVADAAFLGQATTLTAARERVDFAVGVPSASELGAPQVYLAGQPSGGRVSLLYPAGDRLPAMGDTRVGLFLTQFRGHVNQQLLTKVVAEGADVTSVQIDGLPAWWIEGAHEVLYVDRAGDMSAEPARFSDSVLLWARDGVTLRLESGLDRDQAIAIAASLR
ncbi:MAG TPA: hypothetical protein VK891_05680 [Euzebyales bacterium]|nr:hypothetical protein [Euzebyales bacterium]